MQLRKFEHIGVMVSDMDRSIEFYTRILGLELRDRRPFRDLELAFLALGGVDIELIAGEAHDKGDAQVNHIAFSVKRLEDAISDVKRAAPDIEFTDIIELWPGARCVFFRGPDAERLEFVEREGNGA